MIVYFGGQPLRRHFPNGIAKLGIRSSNSNYTSFLKNIDETAKALRPFFFTSLFFAAAPISVIAMSIHYVRRLFKKKGYAKDNFTGRFATGSIALKQSIPKHSDEESSFFHSPAFTITTIAVVGLGLPALAIIVIYSVFNLDRLMPAQFTIQRMAQSRNTPFTYSETN